MLMLMLNIYSAMHSFRTLLRTLAISLFFRGPQF